MVGLHLDKDGGGKEYMAKQRSYLSQNYQTN
jgi:hypothetical protein